MKNSYLKTRKRDYLEIVLLNECVFILISKNYLFKLNGFNLYWNATNEEHYYRMHLQFLVYR